jgi:hypothetical protein
MSLPEDVIAWLRSIHHDLARAIVSLHEERHPGSRANGPSRERVPPPLAELVLLPRRRGLIVVQPQLQTLPGIARIPLGDGRAFLALEPLKGLADLELAVMDRLDGGALTGSQRTRLEAFRQQLRAWRRTPGLRFTSRSIIVAEGIGRKPARRSSRSTA